MCESPVAPETPGFPGNKVAGGAMLDDVGISFARARLTNEELARDVLQRYPEAFAVMWGADDIHDKWVAWCRSCIAECRLQLASEPPDNWGYAVVDGRLSCDRCGAELRRHTSDHDPTLLSGPAPSPPAG